MISYTFHSPDAVDRSEVVHVLDEHGRLDDVLHAGSEIGAEGLISMLDKDFSGISK